MSARATCGEHKEKLINSVRGRVPLDKVVQPNEGQFSNVKALEITPAKLTKLVSAFAIITAKAAISMSELVKSMPPTILENGGALSGTLPQPFALFNASIPRRYIETTNVARQVRESSGSEGTHL